MRAALARIRNQSRVIWNSHLLHTSDKQSRDWYNHIMKAEILKEIEMLSIAERIELVQDIWDSVAQSDEPFKLSDAQKIELDRRLHDLEENPDAGVPWEKVKADVLSKI